MYDLRMNAIIYFSIKRTGSRHQNLVAKFMRMTATIFSARNIIKVKHAPDFKRDPFKIFQRCQRARTFHRTRKFQKTTTSD